MIKKIALAFFTVWALFALVIMPMHLSHFGLSGYIFPAIDLIVLFVMIVNYRLHYSQIFLIGILLDILYMMPLGSNSSGILAASFIVKTIARRVLITESLTNFLGFACFLFIVIIVRILVLKMSGILGFDYIDLIFQYLISLFSYPLINACLTSLLPYQGIKNL